MPRLNDKTCVVTGAARGIGRAIAERFRDEGAIVILTDIDEIGVETAAGIGCRFERLDVREEADWQRLAEIVPVADVVVNNAGVMPLSPLAALKQDEWTRMIDVNVHGALTSYLQYRRASLRSDRCISSTSRRSLRTW